MQGAIYRALLVVPRVATGEKAKWSKPVADGALLWILGEVVKLEARLRGHGDCLLA